MKVLTRIPPVIGFIAQVLFILDFLLDLYKKYKPKMIKSKAHESSNTYEKNR